MSSAVGVFLYLMTSVSQGAERVRNVEIEPMIAYLIEESPRAPPDHEVGGITSSISSLSVSRMRPALTMTSTFLMFGSFSARMIWVGDGAAERLSRVRR